MPTYVLCLIFWLKKHIDMEMAGKGDGNAIKSHLACIDCNVTHSYSTWHWKLRETE